MADDSASSKGMSRGGNGAVGSGSSGSKSSGSTKSGGSFGGGGKMGSASSQSGGTKSTGGGGKGNDAGRNGSAAGREGGGSAGSGSSGAGSKSGSTSSSGSKSKSDSTASSKASSPASSSTNAANRGITSSRPSSGAGRDSVRGLGKGAGTTAVGASVPNRTAKGDMGAAPAAARTRSAKVVDPSRSVSAPSSMMGPQATKPGLGSVLAGDVSRPYAGPRAGMAVPSSRPMSLNSITDVNGTIASAQNVGQRVQNNIDRARMGLNKDQARIAPQTTPNYAPQNQRRVAEPMSRGLPASTARPALGNPFNRSATQVAMDVRRQAALAQGPRAPASTRPQISIPGGGMPEAMNSVRPAPAPASTPTSAQGGMGVTAFGPSGVATRRGIYTDPADTTAARDSWYGGTVSPTSAPPPQNASPMPEAPYQEPAGPVSPSQDVGQPQSVRELYNRYQYEKQKLKDGIKSLPGRAWNAIKNGDFRAPDFGPDAGGKDNRTPYQLLVEDAVQQAEQAGILPPPAPNKDQLDLVYRTFI